jgi:hypothetical protein
LRPHAAQVRAYADARERASAETGLPLRTFPRSSRFTLEQTLDPKFLPEWRLLWQSTARQARALADGGVIRGIHVWSSRGL